ncbi:MAG: DUF418 domain-containing protein [Sphingopyxis sp.]|nr:DUF418 domain-containing protein [Sphingopyxis sp.]
MTDQERFISLDAIRGVAVMGILAMNIVAFAYPISFYFNPLASGAASAADLATWAFNFVLIDSKMRGLFSMLFGASTLLVMERAAAGGRDPARSHFARMGWLFVFGLVHFYLIWPGDILTLYAACGVLLYFFRNLSIRALLWWAGGFFLISMLYLLSGWSLFALYEAGTLPPAQQAAMAEAMEKIAGEMGPGNARFAEEVALYRSDAAVIYSARFGDLGDLPFVQIAQFLWETMALMLFGMALFKARMLTGAWDAARYAKWARRCFLIAIPPLAALVWYQAQAGYTVAAVFGASLALSAPFDFILTVGWAALIMLAIKSWLSAGAVARLAATGQMAFTNYLVTSIIMTSIFYGYGLGLFAVPPRPALYLFCFGMWAAMLLWSRPWLARFHYGPLEWLWRSLSRGEIQKMTRAN